MDYLPDHMKEFVESQLEDSANLNELVETGSITLETPAGYEFVVHLRYSKV